MEMDIDVQEEGVPFESKKRRRLSTQEAPVLGESVEPAKLVFVPEEPPEDFLAHLDDSQRRCAWAATPAIVKEQFQNLATVSEARHRTARDLLYQLASVQGQAATMLRESERSQRRVEEALGAAARSAQQAEQAQRECARLQAALHASQQEAAELRRRLGSAHAPLAGVLQIKN